MFKKENTKVNLVAELCQNHNGSITLLKEMVHAASEAGIKYIKIQDIISKELTHRKKFDYKKKKNNLFRPYKLEKKRLSKLDLPKNFREIFIEECQKRNCKPLITPFSHSSVDRIKNLDFYSLKIASYDSTSYELITRLKKLKLPFVVSTGATTNKQIKETANFLKEEIFGLLHCVTIYPTPLNYCSLDKIKYLKKFSNIVGWSDHTEFEKDSHVASLASILNGANIVERHFTILDRNKTKDGIVSINQEDAKEFIKLSKKSKTELKYILKNLNKNWRECLKIKNKKMTNVEKLNLDYYRGRFAAKKSKTIFNWQKF